MGRLRADPQAKTFLENQKKVLIDPTNKLTLSDYFKNSQPIKIELGMGMGKFITTQAINNPTINFIGIEKIPTVLYKAINKLNKIRTLMEFDNLLFIKGDAKALSLWFNNQTISAIYLNFSDPWPKDRHANRRLIHNDFLNLYKEILIPNGIIEFKTDQLSLFEFALIQIESNLNWKLLIKDYDLHINNSEVITTEYEEKFLKLNQPIYYLKIQLVN